MKHVSLIALIAAILALGTGVAFAQECPPGCCRVAKEAPKATVSVTARLEKLQVGAEKGCQTSQAMLAKLQKEFKADSTAALIKMVSACEQYAGNGCAVSKQVLAKINGELAQKKQPVTLSMRLVRLDKGCAAGCEKSRTLMASLLKGYDVKDTTALVALVKGWEANAKTGNKESVGKLATLAAKFPSKKPALSVRLARLDQGCAKGCETSKAKMTALVKAYNATDAKALIATVQSWEQKAANGCKSCVGKLATFSAKLAPAKTAVKATATADDAQGTGCKNCGGSCTGCPGK